MAEYRYVPYPAISVQVNFISVIVVKYYFRE
jgi:hypothetical protein